MNLVTANYALTSENIGHFIAKQFQSCRALMGEKTNFAAKISFEKDN